MWRQRKIKAVLLVAASSFLCSCDSGGFVKRDEAAQAFQQRDEALFKIAKAVQELQKRPVILAKDQKGEKKKK